MTGIARHKFAGGEVLCLTDGAQDFAPEVFPGLTSEELERRLAIAGETRIRTEFNCFLLKLDGQPLTLVDTGCGVFFGDRGGRMPALLTELGIAPTDIGRIIFTHLHRDHVGGAFDGDCLRFPDAEVVLSTDEAAAWSNSETAGNRFLSLVSPRTVTDGEAISDGVTAWLLPGHTAGHMGLRVGNLAIVGDIIHSAALQAGYPETATCYDSDTVLATQSRKLALSTAAREGLVIAGGHFLAPAKFTTVTEQKDGFVLTAV